MSRPVIVFLVVIGMLLAAAFTVIVTGALEPTGGLPIVTAIVAGAAAIVAIVVGVISAGLMGRGIRYR